MSSSDSVTLESFERPASLDRSKALSEEEVLEMGHFITRTKHVLLTEAVLRNEEFIAEASKSPSASATDKLTSLKT